MGKCERCGHFNPYWLADWRDVEKEFCRRENLDLTGWTQPQKTALDNGEIVQVLGFAYKASKKFVRRLPLEIFKARGRWGMPYKAADYWDSNQRQERLGGQHA